MQTICPHCQTVFKVSDEHLKVADGYVRCGICKEVFNALEKDQPEDKKESATKTEITDTSEIHLEKDPQKKDTNSIEIGSEKNIEQTVAEVKNSFPTNEYLSNKAVETPATETATSVDTAQTDMFTVPSAIKKIEAEAEAENKQEHQKENTHNTANDATSDVAKQPSTIASPVTATTITPIENIAVTKNITNGANDAIGDNLFDGFQSKLIPDEYRIPELHNAYSIWHDIAWSLAILTLTASLFAEYTWFNRNELISNPQLRPLVTQFCALVNCDAMALREPGEIEMTTRNIYSHPNVKNALMISGTLVNHADFEQPYPNILIDFSDVRGDVIASRVFTPEDYLQIKTTRLRPLAPRNPINFNMEIQDPGKNAMTYEFSFL